MLRISKLTDYGIVLATQMAGAHARGVAQTAGDLAAETRIPAPTVSKVLKRLTRHGVITSVRGAHGGYRLARAAEGISVLEIIEALEGPIAVTECSTDETAGSCEHEGACDLQANWQKINQAVHSALAGISLAEMVRPGAPLVSLLRSAAEADARRRIGAESARAAD